MPLVPVPTKFSVQDEREGAIRTLNSLLQPVYGELDTSQVHRLERYLL